MRYLLNESLYIISRFDSGDNVTISIYDLNDNTLIVDNVSMLEVGNTGYFKYNFVQSNLNDKKEFLYITTNGFEEHAGKIILGGYPTDIKSQTDKMTFDGDYIKAKLDEQTGLTTEEHNQLMNGLTLKKFLALKDI